MAFKLGLPDYQRCDLGLEETASHTFYHCPKDSGKRCAKLLGTFITKFMACIIPKKLVLIDHAYACDSSNGDFDGGNLAM